MAKRGPGRPRKILAEDAARLRKMAIDNPHLSFRKVRLLFIEETGFKVGLSTVCSTLKRMGVTRVQFPKKTESKKAARPLETKDKESSSPQRYGYTNNHRSDRGEQRRYPSSLTDAEWDLIKDIFENTGPGQPPKVARRAIVEACSYIVRSGCSWRMLPKEFPPWQNVYAHFRRWDEKGLFIQMHERLREMWREREGRNIGPSAAILDSQSIKTGPQGGEKGYDAGKKVKGRKRHLVVDVLGLLLAVMILPANVQDRDAALEIVTQAQVAHPTIKALIADGGYAGRCALQLHEQCNLNVEIIKRPPRGQTFVDGKPIALPAPSGFIPLPKRWIVERTNAWVLRFRRLVVDHDRRLDVAKAWIWFSQSMIIMRRLAASSNT